MLLPLSSTGRRRFTLYSSPLTSPSSHCASPVVVGWSPASRASRRLGRWRNQERQSETGEREIIGFGWRGNLRLHGPCDGPVKNAVPLKGFFSSDSAAVSVHSPSSGGGSDSVQGHMTGIDTFRISLSSAVSSSSLGSGQNDGEALGDVFI
ncbi:hypothetical protein Dimus_021460 [Dionaea muscipula]